MFDIGASEILVIVIVAILVIGPKDMPYALRSAGRWIGKIRRMSNHFRAGVDAMIREAEMEETEREWRERNARIMAEHPDTADKTRDPDKLPPAPQMEPLSSPDADRDAAAEAAIARARPQKSPPDRGEPEPPLEKRGD